MGTPRVMLAYSAKVPEIWALMGSIKFKCVTRIRDESEIFDMSITPARNIMILENGKEVTNDCRFFAHRAHGINRERARYPQGPLSEQDAWSMPFALVTNKPALAPSSMDLVCSRCLLDCSTDVPPSYNPGSRDVREPLLDFARTLGD